MSNKLKIKVDSLIFVVQEHFPEYHNNDAFENKDIDIYWENEEAVGPIYSAYEIYHGVMRPVFPGDAEALSEDFNKLLPLYKKALEKYKTLMVFK